MTQAPETVTPEHTGIPSFVGILGMGTVLGFALAASVLTWMRDDFEQQRHDAGYRNIVINVNENPRDVVLQAGFDMAMKLHDAGVSPEKGGSFAILTNDTERQDGILSATFTDVSVFSYGRTLQDKDGKPFADTPGCSTFNLLPHELKTYSITSPQP